MKEIVKRIFSKNWVGVVSIFLLFVAINSLIYFTIPNGSSLDDQWFHFEVANLVRENGLGVIKDFKWIYFTNLAQDGKNYGLTLFHIFIIPFTLFSNKLLGLKVAGVFFASILPAIFYYVLKKFKIKHSFSWVAFFIIFAGLGFYFRTFVMRNYVLTIALFLLEIIFIYKRKFFWVFWLAIIHTWWHMATFWMTPLLVIVFEMVRSINQEKISLKNISFGITGSVLGFLLLPLNSDHLFAPINPIAWVKDVIKTFYNVSSDGIPAGIEGYKSDFFTFATSNQIFLIIFSFVCVFTIYSYIDKKIKGEGKNELTILMESLFIICLGFFWGTISISYRFSDFLFPATFLLFVLIIDYIFKKNLFPLESRLFVNSIRIAIYLIILVLAINQFLVLRQNMSSTPNPEGYEKVGNWLKANTKKGELVFNTKWDQFPMLFFYNSWNYYVIGIEPRALNRYDSDLYWLWHNIVYNGVVCRENRNCNEIVKEYDEAAEKEKDNILLGKVKDVATVIKNDFKSRYVFVDPRSSVYLKIELEKGTDYLEKVYEDRDNEIFIYKVK